ncbi:unnamed protein product, partial [Mesorhabditis belari]|uniref:Uncharacterized protein n=1 Tax=Mesorhabditis belari TaxID=2138241 RepID=A0AAF3FJX7_9BILA
MEPSTAQNLYLHNTPSHLNEVNPSTSEQKRNLEELDFAALQEQIAFGPPQASEQRKVRLEEGRTISQLSGTSKLSNESTFSTISRVSRIGSLSILLIAILSTFITGLIFLIVALCIIHI